MNVYTIPDLRQDRVKRLRAMLPGDSLMVPVESRADWRNVMTMMHRAPSQRRYHSRTKPEGLLIWRSR